MARELGDAGVLVSPWKFRLLARLTRKQSLLKPGEYRFPVPSPPWETLKILLEGKVILHKVTFPEGSTVAEITRVLWENHLIDSKAFTDLLARKDFLQYLKIPADSFEGFLFPETYYFAKTDHPDRMIETMVARFRDIATPQNEALAKSLHLSLLQWVTLASIVEKETSVVDEQPTVSSVFHNRLKKKMRLQSDPTVIYGIKNFNGNITKKDLETTTLYNTYRISGLPPGPIANPGASSLNAAIHPAQTDYLYFVANGKGTHVFAKTYEEHARNVAIYQLKQRPESVAAAKKMDSQTSHRVEIK